MSRTTVVSALIVAVIFIITGCSADEGARQAVSSTIAAEHDATPDGKRANPPEHQVIPHGIIRMRIKEMGTSVKPGTLWNMRTLPSDGNPGKRFLFRPSWTPGDLHVAYVYKNSLVAKSELRYRLILLPRGATVDAETTVQGIKRSGRGLIIYIDPSAAAPESIGRSAERVEIRGQEGFFRKGEPSLGGSGLSWWEDNGFVYDITGSYDRDTLVRVAESMR